jgi:type IV pilus assembly protein PilE
MRSRAATAGVTLVELLVVVAIVAILAAVAYPSYTQYVMRAQRSDAKVGLATLAQHFERCYTVTHRFDGAGCPSGTLDSPERFYTITVSASAAAYSLVAAPQRGRVLQDTHCGSFTLNSRGQRGVTGSGNTTDCW